MEPSIDSSSRRSSGDPAVHSLHRFVFSVPDVNAAVDFYTAFGLDVRRMGGRVDLRTFGNSHRWAEIFQGHGPKRLEYISFGAYPQDYDAIIARIKKQGVEMVSPHRHADKPGCWFVDPDGTLVEMVVSEKVSPTIKATGATPAVAPGRRRSADARHGAGASVPVACRTSCSSAATCRRWSSSIRDTLGLRLSDHSGDAIAFLHGAHASDHHMIAFCKSDGPGLHHSSWDVGSFDEVGLGMQQMIDAGHPDGWGVGRHVVGSNYFRYVRDPWGSFAEYSYDIDFIPHDLDWQVQDHKAEDSFYVWGPPVPGRFHHQSRKRRPPGSRIDRRSAPTNTTHRRRLERIGDESDASVTSPTHRRLFQRMSCASARAGSSTRFAPIRRSPTTTGMTP